MFGEVGRYIKQRILRHEDRKPGSPLDDLEKLASLKEKGIITDEEFQAKKKSILGIE